MERGRDERAGKCRWQSSFLLRFIPPFFMGVRMLRYETKVRMAALVLAILFVGFINNIADGYARERERLGATVSELESTVQELGEIRESELGSYRATLMTIVDTLYGRELYSMGGYDAATSSTLDVIRDAILNATMDYRSLLAEVNNYFDARAEHLRDVPSIWPIEYAELTRITSGFGWRLSPISGTISYHPGIDIAGVWNAKIICTADGTVVKHWLPPGVYRGVRFHGHGDLGGKIVVEHENGFRTVYGHLSRTFVHEGMQVRQGDVIGIMGDTGKSAGQHLHYEVHLYGEPVNPLDFLKF